MRSPVSVIIVSHDSGPLLVESVLSALASIVPVEVIVSDNGSDDGSIEPLDDLAVLDSRLRVLHNGSNLGFAAANNRALAFACGEYVLFLNPDCVLRRDTIDRMVAALGAVPDAGMAGCLIRNPDGTVEENCRRHMPTPGRLISKLLGQAKPSDPEMGVEAISGAFMLVRHADLDRLGAFDEGYFLHWEDLDLCRRFQDAGRGIHFAADIEVVHFKGRSSRRRPLWVEWQKHRGLMRFLRKFHFRGWRALAYPPVVLAIGLRFLARSLGSGRRPAAEPPIVAATGEGDSKVAEVWVFGATSLVGRYLLPRLLAAGYRVRAFCTDPVRADIGVSPRLTLHGVDLRAPESLPLEGKPSLVISLAPIFALPGILPVLAARGASRIIAFGSTSAITKAASTEPAERELAERLSQAETAVQDACGRLGLRWCIFRTTMIYAFGKDGNVTRLAALARRLRFFPLAGDGRGLRQPVHADDLARACLAVLDAPDVWNRAYDLSGSEVLSYRTMMEKIFRRLGRAPRLIEVPEPAWRLAIGVARCLPRFRDVNIAMARRMNADLSFPHAEAARAFGFAPRRFLP